MYETFRDVGFGPTKQQYDEQVELLGREPRRYEDYVTETAKEWRGEPEAATTL